MDRLCLCGREGVQKTEVLSSPVTNVAAGLPCALSGVFFLMRRVMASVGMNFSELQNCLRQVACEGHPSPQCQDNISCSPIHPAACLCPPLHVCSLLVFHSPTITCSSTSTLPTTSSSPWTCSCCVLLYQPLLTTLFFLVVLPYAPHP